MLKRYITSGYRKILNWTTCLSDKTINDQVIVIESDDWGSLRMPNRYTYDRLLRLGYKVDECPYCKNDSIARKEDLFSLYEVLSSYRDLHNRNPVMTANTIVGNPDFEKIKKDNFSKYYYESFLKTLDKTPNCSFRSWQEGISNGLFHPQYHGREHLNICRWLRYLKRYDEFKELFNNNFYGLSYNLIDLPIKSIQASLDYDTLGDKRAMLDATIEGYRLFSQIFKYKSDTFVPTNYIAFDEIYYQLSLEGVSGIQSCGVSYYPGGKSNYIYMGKKNQYNQLYTYRNCFFEPSLDLNKDWVDSCLKDISIAFRRKQPAIICSHRVNYIGSVFEKNRTRTLLLLNKLLSSIKKKWPQVIYLTSDELISRYYK